MEADQSADLAAAMAEVGHPSAPKPDGESGQSGAQTPPESGASGQNSAPNNAPEGQQPEQTAEQKKVSKHQEVLQRMMEKARQERESQTKEQQQRALQEQAAYAQRLLEARQYGPEAFYKAAGVEPPAPKTPSLADLFGDSDDEPKTPAEILELKEQVSKMDQYIKKLEEERSQEKQTLEQQNMQYHIQQEIKELETQLNETKDKYQFIDAAREMGSINDLYNGRVSMYNQGYNPSNEDMLELVEARMEELIRLTAPTKKGRALIEELYGISLPDTGSDSKSLSDKAGGDTPARIAEGQVLSDEENRQLALKEAYAARERLMKQMGK